MLERLAAVRAARPDAVLGVHLEGPFLGGAPGAHPVDPRATGRSRLLAALCDRFGDLIRLVTLAPEADPGLAGIAMLHDRGVVVALGHSTVDYDGARAAVRGRRARRDASVQRHGSVASHRAPGLPGAALSDHGLVPSIIADGIHVHPAMVRLALDARPDAVLVTDAGRDREAGRMSRRCRVSSRRNAGRLDAHDDRRRAARRRARCRARRRGAVAVRATPRTRSTRPHTGASRRARVPTCSRSTRRRWPSVASGSAARRSRPGNFRPVEIVAALFVEGIDFRQVAGPATRIDITGAFFSTVVDAYPARLEPHLVVLVRAPMGSDGNANAGNGVPARRRRDRPEPPDLLRGAREVRIPPGEGRVGLSRAGHDRGPAARSSTRCRRSQFRSPRFPFRDRASTSGRWASNPRWHGSRELLCSRAPRCTHSPSSGRRGRRGDHRAIRR